MAADEEISLRLLVDTKSNKVLFVEANHEFIDIILSLLTLPMGVTVKLMSASAMHGSIGRLYQSVDDIDDCYLQPSIDKIDLLSPTVTAAISGYVKETETYIMTDGLEVTPMSAISTVALMNIFVLNKCWVQPLSLGKAYPGKPMYRWYTGWLAWGPMCGAHGVAHPTRLGQESLDARHA